MGAVERYPPGTFCWVDLATPDLAAARVFFEGLFGWRYEEVPAGNDRYTLVSLDGFEITGLDAVIPGDAAGWRSYLAVDDLDGITARARSLGAEILGRPDDLPFAAPFTTIRDPAGALVTLWKTERHHGARLVNEVGTWSWTELVAPDIEATAAFYAKLLGWTVDRAPGLTGRVGFSLGQRLIAGGHAPQPGEAEEPRWDVAFRSADVDATASQATASGGSVILAPMDIPAGRFAILADPSGIPFTVSRFAQPVRGVDGS